MTTHLLAQEGGTIMVANPNPARKAISKRLRYEILRRDNSSCRYCGASAPDVKLTVDHVLPVALGGSADPSNLVTACVDCNAGKSSSNPDQSTVTEVSEDAMRWAEAVRTATMGALVEYGEQQEYCEFIADHWVASENLPTYKQPMLPRGWGSSIDAFRRRGLPIGLLTVAATKALKADHIHVTQKWRYFMGIAWRMLDDIEKDAKRVYDMRGGGL